MILGEAENVDFGLTTDSDALWLSAGRYFGGTPQRGLYKLPLAGGPTTQAALVAPLAYAGGLTLDGTYAVQTNFVGGAPLYRTLRTGGSATSFTGTIGSSPCVLNENGQFFYGEYFGQVGVISAGGSARVLATAAQKPTDLALDDTWVFWASEDTSPGNGGVFRASRDGGTPQRLVTVPHPQQSSYPGQLAVDSTWVYYLSLSNTQPRYLHRMLKDGSMPQVIDSIRYGAVRIDGTGVYWTDSGDGGMLKRYRDDAGVELLLGSISGARALHLGADAIYFSADQADGGTTKATLRRVAKP